MPLTDSAPPATRASAPVAAAPARFRPAQVVGRAVTARDTVTFWLAAPGTTHAPAPYQPGQFITLALPDAANPRRVLYRSYSLCGDGRADQPWEITVKRQSRGVGSGYLHDHVALGATLPVSAPSGAFTLPQRLSPAASLIFVAAGSGITPIYAMLRALAAVSPARRPRVQLHYAYHDAPDAIYGDAINALDPQRTWLRQWRAIATAGQRMTAAAVVAAAGSEAAGAEWYLCGPNDLMRAVGSAARRAGVASERIHTERFFTPPTAGMRAATAGSATARVRIAETGAALQTKPGETLLETLERCGYAVDSSCRAGSCGTCRLRVTAGRTRNPDGQALTPTERKAGYVESCVAQPLGDVTIALDRAVTAPRAGGQGRGRLATVAPRASRAASQRRLRWTLAVASIALFGVVWNLTDHKITASAATASSGSSSSATNSSSGGSGSSGVGSSSSSSASSGSSGFTSQPSFSGSSNTQTGMS